MEHEGYFSHIKRVGRVKGHIEREDKKNHSLTSAGKVSVSIQYGASVSLVYPGGCSPLKYTIDSHIDIIDLGFYKDKFSVLSTQIISFCLPVS